MKSIKPIIMPFRLAPVNNENSCTMEDPIPYMQNMALGFNKYYTQGGVLYLCIQAMTPGPYDLKDIPAHAQPIKQ